jgi:hypothetical protein
MTISQGLSWMKTLKERHLEPVGLRNANAHREDRLFGGKQTVKREPVCHVRKPDALVHRVAMEIRRPAEAIKETNSKVEVTGFRMDEAVLGRVA